MFTLPQHSIVKVFAYSSEFSPEVVEQILSYTKNFIAGWSAHGKRLKAEVGVLYKRFLVIAVDQKAEMPSGCSIDKLFHCVLDLENTFSVKLTDNSLVFLENEGQIKAYHFGELANISLTEKTKVINLLCRSIEDLDSNFFLNPENSPYARLFSLPLKE